MADEKLYEEGKPEVGFEEAAPDVIAKDMTINEAVNCLAWMRDTQLGAMDVDDPEDYKDLSKAIDMAIEALFDEMVSAERFKHFAMKYGNYKENKNE